MNILFESDYVYINLLENLKNRFVFIAVLRITEAFSLSAFETQFDMKVAHLRKIENFSMSGESVFLSQKANGNEWENSISDVLFPPSLAHKKLTKTDTLHRLQIQHFYQIDTDFVEREKTKQVQIKQSHFYSHFIQSTENRLAKFYAKAPQFIRVVLGDTFLIVLAYKNLKFHSIHRFEITTLDDGIYHIINTLQNLELKIEEQTLYLNYLSYQNKAEEFEGILLLYAQKIEKEYRPLAFDYAFELADCPPFLLSPFFEVSICEL